MCINLIDNKTFLGVSKTYLKYISGGKKIETFFFQ